MDHRSWPWKKKSSNKTGVLKALPAADPASSSLASVASLQDQGNKKLNYVQITFDSYTHLTGLENEVKDWRSRVRDLEEQLSAAKLEITAKDNLATQHSKVAEEAVSGWEKADAEASALKNQLESVSLLKLTAEDRASNLDGALKECLIQLRLEKEEHHEKMNEVILTKNRYCNKIKADLEVKITELEQKLLRSAAEKGSLSRSVQEHSNMLMKINNEKSQVEVENELLRKDIQSCKNEISSLKYEVHVVSDQLDIRNEEKNMSVRSVEAANKQYLDGVKKIAKLEAECQRLRGLLKKKLPGPAALAQMKLEVEQWENESIRSKSPSNPDIHENELMKRVLGTEEEMKMLKEALSARMRELQNSRDLSDKMICKIRDLEMEIQILNQQKNSPRSVFEGATAITTPNSSNTQSVTSLSENGCDDDGRYSDLSNITNDKIRSRSKKSVIGISLDLMDDFIEMERIANAKDNSKNASQNDAKNIDLSDQDLVDIVSGISKFIMRLKSITVPTHDSSTVEHVLVKECEDLSASLDKFLSREFNLVDLFLNLSRILAYISDLKVMNSPKSHSDSGHGVPIPLETDQLKGEKDNMAKEIARLSQDTESKKLQLEELDMKLTEARSELASARKCNGFAETQLKCMTESYKLLETRAQEQEANLKDLREKIETLEAMLEEEKHGHGKALARIKDIEDQIQRKESCQECSSPTAHFVVERKKEREIADAAAKLAECQETIFLLGKQLKALHHPQKELNGTSSEHKLVQSFRSPQSKSYSHDFESMEIERASSLDMRVFDESPLHSYESSSSPSSGELSQRVNKSFCSSNLASATYFPSKGKH